MKLRLVDKSKPLCQIENDVFLVFRKGRICIYDYRKRMVIDSMPLPLSLKELLFIKFRLTSRLFRMEPRDAEYLGNGKCIVSYRGRILFCDINRKSVTIEHKYRKGMNNPLKFCRVENISGFEDCILYGEYFGNAGLEEVNVYSRQISACVEEWKLAYTFSGKEINHIHSIVADSYRNCLWILTGDTDRGSGIWMVKDGFQSVTQLVLGAQQYRACALAVRKNYLLYCTDTPLETNYIYKITDLDDSTELTNGIQCRVNTLHENPGPCVYYTSDHDNFIYSTTVEPDSTVGDFRYRFTRRLGVGVKDRYSHLIRVNDREEIHELYKIRKDAWPMLLFQFGSIQFPKQFGRHSIHCYFRSTVRYDGMWIIIEDRQQG